MAYTEEQNQAIRDYVTANIDNPAAIAAAAAQYGVSADALANAVGVSTAEVANYFDKAGIDFPEPVAAPVISFTESADSEGRQYSPGIYEINGKTVNPIYKNLPGTGGDDPNAGSPTANIQGFTGGIERINGQDVVADYDASGKLLGYRPYAGESFFSSVVKPLLPIITAAVAPGLSNLIGGATGLTGANLAAATGATIGGGSAALTGNNALQGALLGGLGGYYSGGGFNTAADQGLNSKLTMAQIESGLGTPGYGYGAQAAESGLFNPALIGSGAYTQTSYPYDMAEFLAADAQNLYSQVGSNLPAIEQNLVASGVDPLVAADIANTITLNPNMSTYDLTNYINTTFGGGNLYDVNAATQYPTSVLPDEGGLLSNLPTTVTPPNGAVTTTPVTTTPGTKAVDPDLAKMVSSGISKIFPGLLTAGALNQMTNKPSVGALPTQGVPTNSPEYYQAIQQYYNTYMPEQPRDVATPLQQWYDSKYGA